MELLTTSQSNFAGIPMIMGVDSQGNTWVKSVDVQKAVGKPDNSIRGFMKGKSPEAILAKGSQSEKVFKVPGYNKPINFVSTTFTAVYWQYQAKKGNKLAQSLVIADLAASLDRQAKETNGIGVTAAQHEATRSAIREDLIAQLLDKHQAGTWLERETMQDAGLTKVEMEIAGWEAYIKGKQLTLSRQQDEENRVMFQKSIDMAQENIQKIKQKATL